MDPKRLTFSPRQIGIALALVVALLLALGWQRQKAEEARVEEEIATANGLAKVVASTFAGRTDLKVSTISGTIDVTSVDQGPIFSARQKATLPFAVDYFVDLSRISPDTARYNARTKTLTLEVPPVRVADPNIDLTKGTFGTAQGFWVSRQASAALIRRGVSLARGQAGKTAADPANVGRAREEARKRIAALLQVPLSAAGHDEVRVAVRFPEDGAAEPSQLDRSLSYNQAVEQARRRREGAQ